VTDPDRVPAAWNRPPQRRSISELLWETVGDVRDLVAGRRMAGRERQRQQDHGPRRDLPALRSAGLSQVLRRGWPQQPAIRGIRAMLHVGVVRPLLVSQVYLEVGGIEELQGLPGPVLMVANHASHLDIPLVLESLPAAYRRRTGIAVIRGSALTSASRTAASAIAFNTVAQGSDACDELLETGWNVLVFGEPSRSKDGFVGDFTTDAAALALTHRVPVIPVGIRGSFAAMPRGRNRPVLGWPGGGRSGPAGRTRPRVSVRFGPALAVRDGESGEHFTDRVSEAVTELILEDVTTWWQSRTSPERAAAGTPPAGSWRRIWEASQSAEPGGQARRPKIWP
jgi:1-acyl-sn-glycerol-3-phosphate acyltransferase